MKQEKISGKLIRQVQKYAKSVEKQTRYEHSKRVAKVCVQLAKQFHLDVKSAYLIGIAHDICKHYDKETMLATSKRRGEEILPFYIEDPHALHGMAAAVIMKEKFEIQNESLLTAVSNHVTGKIGMDDYSKILFIADKVEPGRKFSTKEYQKKLFEHSLDEMVGIVLKQSFEYITKKGYTPYPGSKDIVDYYNK